LIAMLSLTFASIRANARKFVLTAVAVVLGVAFMTATFVLTDTIQKSYDDVATNVYAHTDAVVRSARHTDGDQTVRGTVDTATLDAVRAAPGVRAAEPQLVGTASIVGHDGRLLDANRNRAVPVAVGWQGTPELNPMRLVTGHAPRAPDDVVIDVASQRKGRFHVGETVRVVSPAGSHAYRLAGVATYGGSDSAAGAQVVAFTPATAAHVIGTPGRYSAIQVVGAPGVSRRALVANVRAAVHRSDVEVITGSAAAADARDARSASSKVIGVFLMIFAVVALVVGSFVIANTFSITVAQRTRDTALLRAIGATRRQVTRAIRTEALVVGVVASAVGVVAGIGTAQGLRALLGAFGLELPPGGTVVAPRSIVIAMAVGIVVTWLAAWLPARKAAKVAPVEALRSSTRDASRVSKRRTVLGVVVGAVGGLAIAGGLSGGDPGVVGFGALGVFGGVGMAGPAIARRFARVAGWPLAVAHGTAGVLARDNAARNPRRTSATASALMVGVALVAFMSVCAASAKASLSRSLDKAMTSEFIVTTQYGMGGISTAATARIDALPETGSVTALRQPTTRVDGVMKQIAAFDASTVEHNVHLGVRSGRIAALGTHGIAVQTDEAKKRHLSLGSTVSVFFPETGNQRMTVVATYATKQPVGDYSISLQAYDANVANPVDEQLLVSPAPGVSDATARHAIERVLRDYPTGELMTKAEFDRSVSGQIDQTLNLVYVLLATALVIALFGIANTLALSVFERTREVGLLRALGMDRAQVRATVRWESVLIALLGTMLGTAIGLGFGWALVRAMTDQGVDRLVIPVARLVVVVGVAAVAAVVAAELPGRRAANLDVLRATASQ
jgi:putative ABC transport system permease protein